MPTNLPAEYYKVEERLKEASSPEEKIKLLEELISTVPKHKGTDKLRADLRRKLSKMRAGAQAQRKASRHVSAFHVGREGAGQAAVVGPANVGKSALITALTNASPEVANHPFTTWTPTPGMMIVDNVQIQLIDTPPLNREYVEPALMDLIRRADLILLVVDLQADPIGQLEEAVALLEEHNIVLEGGPQPDVPAHKITALPVLVVVNRNDDESTDEDFEILCELLGEEWNMLPVSAKSGRNLDALGHAVIEKLELIRVYAKPPFKEVDLSAPFVMKKGGTVEEFAGKVHKDFYEQLKSARIWGSGVFDGQMVGRDHVLEDGDVVELRT
jgi:ribosome-interacting GTPase 1